ncbi:MAG: DUF4410 domain-containing protein [Proteobacteria bacterium]|nr:DUF4410 domain-containing protein [Pseudomonadota bacterium]
MIKKLVYTLAFITLAFSFGCSTKSQYVKINESQNNCPSYFNIGEVVDSSNYVPGKDDPKISPAVYMKNALQKELIANSIYGKESKDVYTIQIEVLNYAPGNAFARWIMPGLGASKLNIQTTIVDCKGTPFANIPIDRSVAAGGGYTIGAWEYVFVDVSERLVKDLKKNVLNMK